MARRLTFSFKLPGSPNFSPASLIASPYSPLNKGSAAAVNALKTACAPAPSGINLFRNISAFLSTFASKSSKSSKFILVGSPPPPPPKSGVVVSSFCVVCLLVTIGRPSAPPFGKVTKSSFESFFLIPRPFSAEISSMVSCNASLCPRATALSGEMVVNKFSIKLPGSLGGGIIEGLPLNR